MSFNVFSLGVSEPNSCNKQYLLGQIWSTLIKWTLETPCEMSNGSFPFSERCNGWFKWYIRAISSGNLSVVALLIEWLVLALTMIDK